MEPIKIKSPEELAAEVIAEIPQISNSTIVNTEEAYQEEQKKLETEQILKIRKLKAEVEKFEQDNEGRMVLRNAIFIVTAMWMFMVFLLVWRCAEGRLHLSDTVLITLITTTTANVFGFLYVVVNYLYNKDKST